MNIHASVNKHTYRDESPEPYFLYFYSRWYLIRVQIYNFSPSQAFLGNSFRTRLIPRLHTISCQIQLAASVVNQHFEVVEEVVAYHAFGARETYQGELQ